MSRSPPPACPGNASCPLVSSPRVSHFVFLSSFLSSQRFSISLFSPLPSLFSCSSHSVLSVCVVPFSFPRESRSSFSFSSLLISLSFLLLSRRFWYVFLLPSSFCPHLALIFSLFPAYLLFFFSSFSFSLSLLLPFFSLFSSQRFSVVLS